MPLNLDEAARMLGVSSGTVSRWAREGVLGVRRPSGEFRFETAQLRRWARSQGLKINDLHSVPIKGSWPAADTPGSAAESSQPLTMALSRGGSVDQLDCETQEDVLRALVAAAPLPTTTDRNHLLEQLFQRENLSSTGLGHGVALPHPRTPSAAFSPEAMVVLGQLREPMDWDALDGEPVHTVLLLLNPSPEVHLKVLSRLAFLLREDRFQALLSERADFAEILALAAELEPTEPS
jgi:nitrogen PTS system EIIA component